MVGKRLRFRLRATEGLRTLRAAQARFRPNNQTFLNRTEWRGKEPRSCAVTKVTAAYDPASTGWPVAIDIEVSYRPKGHITYLGTTKYDGWTLMVLNRARDGTLLDRNGDPLKDGEAPVELPNEVFQDMDFNQLDFGELIEEVDIDEVPSASLSEVLDEITANEVLNTDDIAFTAPHRYRPLRKVTISAAPTEQYIDPVGVHSLNLSLSTPHLEYVLIERLIKLFFDFLEGKVDVPHYGTRNVVYVEFSESLITCRLQQNGIKDWTGLLRRYSPRSFLDEIAKRVMAVYIVDVFVVDGSSYGLVLRQVTRPD